MEIIPYNEFSLTEKQINLVKKMNAESAIRKYIKENGVAPADIQQYFVISTEDAERYKRIYYAQ